MDASGRKQGLKKLVLTQGTVENILEAWKIEKQTRRGPTSGTSGTVSFTEFLDQRLKTTLTFKEYPKPDRILAAKILASKGFLRTLTPQDLDLPNNTFDFDAARALRGNEESIDKLKQDSADQKHITLTELSDLDPFNKRKPKTQDVAQNFGLEPEIPEPTPASQEVQEKHNNFLLDTFTNFWSYNQDQLDQAKLNLKPEIISPNNIVWEQRKEEAADASKSGQYTLNPETQNLNFDQARVFIPDLSSMNGKSLAEVGQYIQNQYGSRYFIPGIEYWEYVSQNPDKAPNLKDGKYYFYFGSILRRRSGFWGVPCSIWDGSRFGRDARWLSGGWLSNYRVVLLEK